MQSPPSSNLHVGLIMDGNGRWATRRGLPRSAGHLAGVTSIGRTIAAAPPLGIGTLTFYAFSSANWRRPVAEVEALMSLLRHYLSAETRRFVSEGIRLRVIGRRDRMPGDIVDAIAAAECATIEGQRLTVRIALDYSGRDAILDAAARYGDGQFNRERFSQILCGDSSGDVDLVIRTSGEIRLSDFLLWESAYAELYFTECLWPDFGRPELEQAMAAFGRRVRTHGSLVDAA